MPATIVCPKCQTKLNLPDSALGKQVRCPKCSATLRTPAASGGSAAEPSGSPPARPAGSQKPAAAASGKTTIRCPGCSKQLAVSAALAGKVVQCPQCSQKLKVPGGKPAAGRASAQPSAPQAPADPFGSAPSAGGASPFDFGPAPSAAAPAPSFGAPGGGFPSGPAAGAPSPYAPPQGGFAKPAPGGSASGSGDRSTFYMINGILITLWGILTIVGALLRIGLVIYVLSTQEVPNETKIGMGIDAFFGVVGLILGMIMTRGGIGMAMRNSLTSARTAAVVAAIPCFGLCVFPFGIWACVLVFSDQAKRDFN